MMSAVNPTTDVVTSATATGARNPCYESGSYAGTVFRRTYWETVPGFDEFASKVKQVTDKMDRTEPDAERGKDWTACRCCIHTKTRHDEQGALGCAALTYGTHGAIKSLYEGNHRACLIEPGAAKLDYRLFMCAEYGEWRGKDPMRKFMKGYHLEMEKLGAGYCYTLLFDSRVRLRIARILGPLPSLGRVLRYVLCVGSEVVEGFSFRVVEGLGIHIETDGHRMVTQYEIVKQLLPFAAEGVRVGIDLPKDIVPWPTYKYANSYMQARLKEPEMLEFSGWLVEHGVVLVEAGMMDAILTTIPSHSMPEEFVDGKQRVKLLAVIGDAILNVMNAMSVYSCCKDASEYNRRKMQFDNKSIITVMREGPLCRWYSMTGLVQTSNARATAFEALVGVVYSYCGLNECWKLIKAARFPVLRTPEHGLEVDAAGSDINSADRLLFDAFRNYMATAAGRDFRTGRGALMYDDIAPEEGSVESD